METLIPKREATQPLPGRRGGGWAKERGYTPEAWRIALDSAFSFVLSL